jgi:tetraacyldisaccharide 4'-kinase
MKPPSFWYHATPAPGWTTPLAWLYGVGQRLHVALTTPAASPLRTICIGNLTAGGAGKTPVTMAVRALLADHGPTVLLRGYGGLRAGPYPVEPDDSPLWVGDEALLHRRHGPTMIARDRLAGVNAIKAMGGKLVIMDDGLQNRRLKPDIRIAVVDGTVGIGNGALLPAGPLREPLNEALARLDAVIMLGQDRTRFRARLDPALPYFTARVEPVTHHLDPSKRYVVVAGIARPEKFFAMLADLGITVVATHTFPDHHAYNKQDVTQLMTMAEARQATLLTTEKDAVKIMPLTASPIATLPIRVVFDDEPGVRAFLDRALAS